MYKKHIYVCFVAVLITAYSAEGKKSRRNRRPTNEEDTTPQPSVVSYSTFGFNDVGSYDGFVPTSPDYASYLSDNQESTTRLYAPAFPSAGDSTGFNNNFGSPLEGAPFGHSDDSVPQSSMVQYAQSSVNFFNTPSFDEHNSPNKNFNEPNRQSEDDPTGLVYGTKLSSKNKKNMNPFNHTEFNVYSSGPLANANDLASRFVMPGIPSTHEGKNPYGESSSQDQNIHSYAPNYPSSDVEEFVKPAPSNPHNALKFPRVVDFTKFKEYYPTEIDNKYQVASYSSILNTQNENSNMFSNNNEDQSNKYIQPTPTLKDPTSFKTQFRDEDSENESTKQSPFQNQDYRPNFISSAPLKQNYKGSNYNLDYKDNFKNKWNPGNYSNNEAQATKMSMKGYEYSTDYSNTSFRYDFEPNKKPFNSNFDELTPASSNIVDLTSYNFPDNDFSNSYKKIPESKYPFDEDFGAHLGKENKYKNDEFINQFKNLYTTTPVSQWGNAFKANEHAYKHRTKKPQFEDNFNSDVVHIPKRPSNNYKFNYGKNHESKPSEYPKQRPYKSNKYEKPKDWNKEVLNTRFKSEEDLLGLRNHDTSHPSYIPSHRPSSNDLDDESDYKKLVEKWRQSYLKSKYKDAYRDYESYASEAKPLHVPIPKPYPIEVPHPVIVPVPQPYPVRVPIPKPVAVPVIRELTVPIEKPVPYPVIKKVPYPVEKLVPVPVEKEVPVPVVKPYPVHIPHVRPVFHHSRPPREDFDSEVDAEEDDYLPRPESSKRIPPYKKRPRTYSTRNRPRRPTRTSYPDRNTRERRRWPTGNRPADTRSRRPSTEYRPSPPYKYHEYEPDSYDNEQTDYYYLHCKRTGNC